MRIAPPLDPTLATQDGLRPARGVIGTGAGHAPPAPADHGAPKTSMPQVNERHIYEYEP
jgi:hypothetical protein